MLSPRAGAVRLAALALLFAVAVCAAPGSAQPAYGTNLIVNGDAESDTGAPDNSTIVKPSGWTTTGEFTAVQYGASGGFPDKTSPGPADRGKNLFEGGNAANSTATQTISLAPYAADIQAGTVHYEFAGWLGGYSNQDDNAIATVSFVDAAGASLGQATIGSVTAAQRQDVTGLLARTQSGLVPKGATNAVVTITITRVAGEYNDGSVDNLTLKLSK